MERQKYQNKLKRLGQQLALSEHILQNHPAFANRLKVLPLLLHYLNLQMQWTLASPFERLFMTFRSALQGYEVEKSQTGFVGKALSQLEHGVALLMRAALAPSEKELSPLLLTCTQAIVLGTIFMATQLEENWKRLFPQQNHVEELKGGFLLKELGLTFLLSSGAVKSVLRSFSHGLGLKESSQKKIADLGIFFLLSLLILLEDFDEEEFLENIKKIMLSSIDSIRQVLLQAEIEHLFEETQAERALDHLHAIKKALESTEKEAIKHSLSDCLTSFGIRQEEIKADLKKLFQFCSTLNKSFKNIFDQTEMTVTTTIIQAA